MNHLHILLLLFGHNLFSEEENNDNESIIYKCGQRESNWWVTCFVVPTMI